MQHTKATARNHFAQFLLPIAIVIIMSGCDNGAARRAATQKAQAQVGRIAEELDKKTTLTGSYIRVEENAIKETDPWGTPLEVSYSQGGVAETLTVRSAGPDKMFHTDDDVVGSGMSANFKGVGNAIKNNAQETAANVAKGAVKGAVEGAKETIKESLPLKWKKKTDPEEKSETDADDKEDAVKAPENPE